MDAQNAVFTNKLEKCCNFKRGHYTLERTRQLNRHTVLDLEVLTKCKSAKASLFSLDSLHTGTRELRKYTSTKLHIGPKNPPSGRKATPSRPLAADWPVPPWPSVIGPLIRLTSH